LQEILDKEAVQLCSFIQDEYVSLTGPSSVELALEVRDVTRVKAQEWICKMSSYPEAVGNLEHDDQGLQLEIQRTKWGVFDASYQAVRPKVIAMLITYQATEEYENTVNFLEAGEMFMS
jgi:hypothetical protein